MKMPKFSKSGVVGGLAVVLSANSIVAANSIDRVVADTVARPAFLDSLFFKRLGKPAFAVMKDSERKYVLQFSDLDVDSLPDLSRISYEDISPEHIELNFDPMLVIEENDGRRFAYRVELDSESMSLLETSALLHVAGDTYQERFILFRLLEKYPSLSTLHMGVGNSYFKDSEFVTAMEWFEKGIAVNPVQPQLHNFLASCYLQLGLRQEAYDCLEESIIRCRSYSVPWIRLNELLAHDHERLVDLRFVDPTLVEEDSTGAVNIHVDSGLSEIERLAWMSYAAAQAVWQYEFGAPESLSVIDGAVDSSLLMYRHIYALANLMEGYDVALETLGCEPNQYLEKLRSVIDAGHIMEFIILDNLAVNDYFVTSMLDSADIDRLHNYFEEHCIVSDTPQ